MVDGGISESFDVTTGVLQCDVLAPFLSYWSTTFWGRSVKQTQEPPRQARRYSTKSLDDMDFIDGIANLELSIPRAQSQLSRTADTAADLGLIISAPKTN